MPITGCCGSRLWATWSDWPNGQVMYKKLKSPQNDKLMLNNIPFVIFVDELYV